MSAALLFQTEPANPALGAAMQARIDRYVRAGQVLPEPDRPPPLQIECRGNVCRVTAAEGPLPESAMRPLLKDEGFASQVRRSSAYSVNGRVKDGLYVTVLPPPSETSSGEDVLRYFLKQIRSDPAGERSRKRTFPAVGQPAPALLAAGFGRGQRGRRPGADLLPPERLPRRARLSVTVSPRRSPAVRPRSSAAGISQRRGEQDRRVPRVIRGGLDRSGCLHVAVSRVTDKKRNRQTNYPAAVCIGGAHPPAADPRHLLHPGARGRVSIDGAATFWLPTARVDVPYRAALDRLPIAEVMPALPAGLQLEADGAIGGVPREPGHARLRVRSGGAPSAWLGADLSVLPARETAATTARALAEPGPHAVSVWDGIFTAAEADSARRRVRLYYPAAAGRFPLVVFHHGSVPLAAGARRPTCGFDLCSSTGPPTGSWSRPSTAWACCWTRAATRRRTTSATSTASPPTSARPWPF